MSGIAPKQIAFKFKIAPPLRQNFMVKNIYWQEDPLTNGTLCLSTPKHNGKCGTDHKYLIRTQSKKKSSTYDLCFICYFGKHIHNVHFVCWPYMKHVLIFIIIILYCFTVLTMNTGPQAQAH